MPLPLLNVNGPSHTEARGITPPLMRAMAHVGFSVAVGDQATDENWDEKRAFVLAELREARGHLAPGNVTEGNPFVSTPAVEASTLLGEQFDTLITELNDMNRETTFTDLKTLAENCTYISALLERHVTGNDADEGRNP
jgi:hypothetical protein